MLRGFPSLWCSLFNISADYLIASRAGFPYAKRVAYLENDDRMESTIVGGFHRAKHPLLRHPGGTLGCWPIVGREAGGHTGALATRPLAVSAHEVRH